MKNLNNSEMYIISILIDKQPMLGIINIFIYSTISSHYKDKDIDSFNIFELFVSNFNICTSYCIPILLYQLYVDFYQTK